jgi:hypothetical protein
MEIGDNICRLTRAFYAFDTLQNMGLSGNPSGLPIWFNPAGYPAKPDPDGYPTTRTRLGLSKLQPDPTWVGFTGSGS